MREYKSQQLSKIQNSDDLTIVCSVPILPLATGSNTEGPCTVLRSAPDFKDIVTEAIDLFRFTILLKNRFDIQSSADKVLVYLILWIQRLLALSRTCPPETELATFLIQCARDESSIAVPGEEQFPLNMFFIPPSNPKEKLQCSRYLMQLRIETARRLAPRLIDETSEGGLSKWWTQYAEINWLGFSALS